MKKHNIQIVLTVRAKNKRVAKEKIVKLMNNATGNLDLMDEFPEWGFRSEYKYEKVKK